MEILKIENGSVILLPNIEWTPIIIGVIVLYAIVAFIVIILIYKVMKKMRFFDKSKKNNRDSIFKK